MADEAVCGYIDRIDGAGIVGWAGDLDAPDTPLVLAVVIDDVTIGVVTCDAERRDVAEAGFPSSAVGFFVDMPPWCADGQEHILEVRRADGGRLSRADLHVRGDDVVALYRGVWVNRFTVVERPAQRRTRKSGPMEKGEILRTLFRTAATTEKSETRPQLSPLVQPTPVAMPSADMALIAASGTFLPEWYVAAYPDVAVAGLDPITHYVRYGWRERKRPNPYFDPEWYCRTGSEVPGHRDPLTHYLALGEAAGLKPALHFDPAYYRSTYGIPSDTSCLGHYLTHRLTAKFSPIAEFDVDYYTREYPDVAAAGIDVFEHYLLYGYHEGRNPSPTFRTRFYRQRYMGADDGNPLMHYLQHRAEPGIYPSLPEGESTIPQEVRRFCALGPAFEDYYPLPASAKRRAKILAYYLPQFHQFPENDAWWGNGFTEWTNVARGLPRFVDHFQPRIPRDLGFYTLTADVMHRQVDMARGAGLFGFIFYFYWFNGRRLMERPLDMFLADTSLDFPFCLMWANENWSRRWDGSDNDVLISQDYREADDARLVDTFVVAFRDVRYIRLGGRPLLMIYRPGIIPKCKETVALWRVMFRERGGEDPIMVMSQSFGDNDPTIFGLDGAIEFPPHKLVDGLATQNHRLKFLDHDLTAEVYAYDDIMRHALEEPRPAFPLIKTLVPSWDNDARRQGRGLIIHGSTPAKYQQWLEGLISQSASHPFFGERIICVNAWNEWAEGAYLEPDAHFGSAYLNATARAVVGAARQGNSKQLLLVGHDAFRAGSQLLLLNIGRLLAARFGFQIHFLLLQGGVLESEYGKVAPTKVAASDEERRRHVADLRAQGFGTAIVNTCAAAVACKMLAGAGLECTLLVHEMPRILEEKGLWDFARIGIGFATRLIFAAPSIRDRILEGCGMPDARTVVLPQGSYKPMAYASEARSDLRSHLSIRPKDYLAIGVGYADLRKGFDLFLQAWRAVRRTGVAVHFCWVGDIDPVVGTYLATEIAQAAETGTFHMPGFREDIGAFMSAADVFVLSSREDPYPTVVMEAIAVGIPVIAFEGSGGIPDLLRAHCAGQVIELGDVAAMARAVVECVGDPGREATRNRLAGIAKAEFSFETYVERLCDAVLPQRLRVSVVVPNYNYAHYLTSRLASIFAQTYPVHEVIVLDDASNDESLAVIERVAADWKRDVRVIANDSNSGSVFSQWRKAAQVATGDYIWIAEADDDSDPRFIERLAEAIRTADSTAEATTALAWADSRAVDADGVLLWPDHQAYFATAAATDLRRDGVYPGASFVRRFLSERNLILNVSCAIWHRHALQTAIRRAGHRLMNYRVAGDWHLYVELLTGEDCSVAYVAEPLNIHRRHAASITHEVNAMKHLDEIKRVHTLVRRRLGDPTLAGHQAKYVTEVAAQLGLSASTVAVPAAAGERARKAAPRKAAKKKQPDECATGSIGVANAWLHAPGD